MSNVGLYKWDDLLSQIRNTERQRLEHTARPPDSTPLWCVLLIYMSYSWSMLVPERAEWCPKTVKLHTRCHIVGSLIKYPLFTVQITSYPGKNTWSVLPFSTGPFLTAQLRMF